MSLDAVRAGLSPDLSDEHILHVPDCLLELLPAAVYVCAADGRVVRYNRRAAELWGRAPNLEQTPEIFGGSFCLYGLDGKMLPRANGPMAEVLRTGVPVRGREVVVERPDGSRLITSVSIDVLRNDSGRMIGAVGCFQDITERKRIEEELLASRANFEDFFENAVTAMHWADGDGTILRANQAELDLLGYDREEYVGRQVRDFHADSQSIEEILACLGRGEKIVKRPVTLRAKNGSIKQALIDSSPRLKDGRLASTRCVTLDVTDRERDNALLVGQKRILEMVATGAPLDETLAELTRFIELQEDGLRCGILLVAEDGAFFKRGIGPNVPERYYRKVDHVPVAPPYHGPCGRAAHQDVQVVVEDIANDERWAKKWREHAISCGLASCITTPVRGSDGRPLATFAMYFDRPRDPRPVRPDLIEIATHLAGIAIERERSQAALRESEERLAAELAATQRLQEISTLLIQENEVDALYQGLIDAAAAVMRADMASLQVFHQDRGELRLLAWKGFHPESAEFWEWVRVDSGSTCGESLRTGRRVVVQDVETCEFVVGTPDLDAFRKSGIRAVQSTPLVSRSGRVLGMLSTHWAAPYQPTERDLRLLDVLARQAADLFERARSVGALRESERRLREIVEALPAAVYMTDAEERVTFYNQAAVDLSGRTPTLGSDEWCVTWRIYRPDGTPLPHEQCPMAMAVKENKAIQGAAVIVERPDGTRVPCLVFATPLRDGSGAVVGAVNALVDITERDRAEQAARRLVSIVESSADAIIGKDLAGLVTNWNPGAERLFGYSREEAIGMPVANLIPADRRDEEVMVMERIRRGESVEHFDTLRRRKDGSMVDISLTVSPIRDAGGRIIGASKIARDIAERKKADEQRSLLLEELNHRVKNTLATVQSVATQTLRGKASVAEEREAFESRLIALSKLHELLTKESWQGGALRGVVLGELAPYGGGESQRITVDGPEIRLRPRAALTLGMAVHELATNAAKYGALSSARGHVHVAWKIERGSDGRLRLCWRESGGPPVKPPKRRGFGSRVIERGLAHDLQSEVDLCYAPDGVVCTIELPLSSVAVGDG